LPAASFDSNSPSQADGPARRFDYNDPDLGRRARELATGRVDAVFDHFGMASARISFGLLVRGRALVS
jgi:NADPH:quinone reductase-like Zn-dependent oxidoreductase